MSKGLNWPSRPGEPAPSASFQRLTGQGGRSILGVFSSSRVGVGSARATVLDPRAPVRAISLARGIEFRMEARGWKDCLAKGVFFPGPKGLPLGARWSVNHSSKYALLISGAISRGRTIPLQGPVGRAQESRVEGLRRQLVAEYQVLIDKELRGSLGDHEKGKLQMIERELDRYDEEAAEKAQALKGYRDDIARLDELLRLNSRIRELL